MGISIKMSGLEVSDDSKVFNHVVIKNNEDIDIDLRNSKIFGHASVLSDLEIENMLKELNYEVQNMDKSSKEYSGICEIIKMQMGNKTELFNRIANHLGEFSQGILASVIANYITRA